MSKQETTTFDTLWTNEQGTVIRARLIVKHDQSDTLAEVEDLAREMLPDSCEHAEFTILDSSEF